MEQDAKRPRLSPWAEAVLIASIFAIAVTAGGWLVAGKFSPLNHGVSPDVYASPLLAIWVLVTLPAAVMFVNLFGKLGSEWQYFLCVFVQWMIVGLLVGWIIASIRRGASQQ